MENEFERCLNSIAEEVSKSAKIFDQTRETFKNFNKVFKSYLLNKVFKSYPNRHIIHLAFYSKKKRVRKKNMARLNQWFFYSLTK